MPGKSKVHQIDRILPPTILTIFGATGDLSANYLLPALYHMHAHNLLPEDFRLVCVGRRDFTSEEYLDFIAKKSKGLKELNKPANKKKFLKHLIYFKGDFDHPESFKALAEILSDKDINSQHACYNRLYYFATSPELFVTIAQILKSANLLVSCAGHDRKIRVLVEKPFGANLVSAQALNSLLLKFFSEDQIYRIDHYQGKETVQNLIVARFANSLFEPLWNKENIDHVEISVLYDDTVGHRAEFYDHAGALRDIVQNHALMMLSLIAMNEPRELVTEDIRQEKFNVLRALRPYDKPSIQTHVVRAQYEGYAHELGRQSSTETYVALKAFVDNERWQDVPFYIRTGKALKDKITEISIHFKELPRCLFRGCAANVLTFRIQPDESVALQINNKIPGFGIELHQSKLDFSFNKAFRGEIPSAYERLLLDFIEGDQRLFIRSDEIEASWKFIDSVQDNWSDLPMFEYKKKTEGPRQADEFIAKDLKRWWTR
ncbi:MAG: glucose-6-phosphate dehydrogenase [Patescibacteria group bacterium]|nr:glucose-6-phosphate dehydrogenase [Patescibacteria group bacterium]